MIDIRKLKELVRLMVANDLTELDLRDSEEQVTLRRPSATAPVHVAVPAAPALAAPAAGASVATAPAPADEAPAVDEDAGLTRVESPMVGTFYAAPDPDSPPFAKIGDAVGPDSVLCLVEAMKIFNEIKAECAGTIARVLVKNSESVEFGQPLFLIKPD
ncbi:MAG: acetyl-CoA carboxylase biotin carboxyl carrier protein [Planctomycetota bacterium]|jgi:acetyl-CoA carboxylase biotin carboxyl carrier protein